MSRRSGEFPLIGRPGHPVEAIQACGRSLLDPIAKAALAFFFVRELAKAHCLREAKDDPPVFTIEDSPELQRRLATPPSPEATVRPRSDGSRRVRAELGGVEPRRGTADFVLYAPLWRHGVEFVEIVAEQKIAETVDREDRRFQIVRQNAEQPRQLLGGYRFVGSLFLNGSDGAPPTSSSTATSAPACRRPPCHTPFAIRRSPLAATDHSNLATSDDLRLPVLADRESCFGPDSDSDRYIWYRHQPSQIGVVFRIEAGFDHHAW